MRRNTVIIVALVCFGVAGAATAQSDGFAAKVQESYRKAKNKREIESVTMWCKAQIRAANFPEHNRVMVLALKAIQDNKVEEANNFLKQARALDDLTDNVGALTCRR